MPCFHPIRGFQGLDGKVRPRDYSGKPMTIACGRCRGCRLERSRQWAVRLMHEASMHDQNCWITLTYNKEHLPSDRSLRKPDFQKFMKRYRHALAKGVRNKDRKTVRFYHCGEYGEENHRPHYHACIFGQDFSFDQKPWRKNKQGDQLYRSATLEKLWSCPDCNKPIGHAEIGALTIQSASYTARYIMKKQTGPAAELHYWDYFTQTMREPPYTTMSTRPGIGRSWIDKYITEVFPLDEVITNGHRARPPKYYDTQYERLDPEGFAAMKLKREEAGYKHADDNTPERLAVKEEVLAAQTATLRREL